MISRRQLSAALVGLTAKAERRIAGGFADGSGQTLGHRLRDRARFEPPTRRVNVPVLIVGGGIAGLSAGWWLARNRFPDFLLLEMESQPGGNSRAGEGEAGPYPWAAHYLPVPGPGATLVRELLRELDVLNAAGEFEERYLCHTPQERLFLHGRWQEGLEPEIAARRADHDQYQRFEARMAEFAASGEFRVPRDRGACRLLDLDRLTMADWLRREGFDSEYLRWYVDYACRDDYGARAAATSAWAGIHYFAARREADEKGPLTWPEGNAWLAHRLADRVGRERLRTGEFVTHIARRGTRWEVTAAQATYSADAVIFASPSFLIPYLFDGPAPPRPAAPHPARVYSPWLTANLTLDRWPRERNGTGGGEAPLSWDNVIYRSPALGYVVATHQALRQRPVDRTVWTYYWALADGQPAEVRRMLAERDWTYWKDAILTDLEQAHPDIRSCVSRLDVMRFGHAMARPVPGFLGATPGQPIRPGTGFYPAHADVSGLSIFEEAQYRGVEAARAALRQIGG